MNYLALKNSHERDNHIEFDESTHTYTINGVSDYISVTTWNHTHFKPFDADSIIHKMMHGRNWENSVYYNKTSEQIKKEWEKNRNESAKAGTALHHDIECYYNNVNVINTSPEYRQFIDYVADHPFNPYRTEWMIYDSELKIAGSIDMVYSLPDGNLMIYDWKRSKRINYNSYGQYAATECIQHMPDTNFWHYALQLNTYQAILEKNYDKKVVALSLVVLHPNQETYKIVNIPNLQDEVRELFHLRKKQIETFR